MLLFFTKLNTVSRRLWIGFYFKKSRVLQHRFTTWVNPLIRPIIRWPDKSFGDTSGATSMESQKFLHVLRIDDPGFSPIKKN